MPNERKVNGGGLGAVDTTLLRFKHYREAGKRLRWYFEQQAWRADGMVMLHKYVEGKHQDDCPWCEFRDAS